MSSINPLNLKKRKVLLTGGLGKIGFCVSKKIIQNNGNLIIFDKNIPNKTQKKFIDNNNVVFIRLDLTDYEKLLHISNSSVFKNIHTIINNAAIDTPPQIQKKINFFDQKIEKLEYEIYSNIKMYLYITKIFGKFLYHNKSGCILNVSSIFGIKSPDQEVYKNAKINFEKPSSYTISKSSIYGFTKYMAHYYRKRNVRVNVITLSGVDSNQNKNFKKFFSNKIPLNRMMKVDEAAQAINFLISDYASYINGANIRVDGGYDVL